MQPPSGETRPAEWDEKVLNLVQRYPDAHITYLEHVVLENDSQVEKYHTQLASTYLDRMQVQHSLIHQLYSELSDGSSTHSSGSRPPSGKPR